MSFILSSPPPDASTSVRGLVGLGAQTWAGLKTFQNSLASNLLKDLSGSTRYDTSTGTVILISTIADGPGASGILLNTPLLTNGTANLLVVQNNSVTKVHIQPDGTIVSAGGLTVSGNILATGTITGSNLSGTNTGDVSIGSFGATPNSKGLSITGQLLQLQPADATNPGAISAAAQTIGGVKTFSDEVISTYSTAGGAASGHANFSVPNNPAASSPALANFNNALELGGKYTNAGSTTSADVYIGAMQQRTAGPVITFLNNYGQGGTEFHVADFMWNGDAKIGGALYLSQGGTNSRVIADQSQMYLQSIDSFIVWNNGSNTHDLAQFYVSPGGTLVGSIAHNGDFLGNNFIAAGRLISRNAVSGISIGSVGTAWLDVPAGTANFNWVSANLQFDSGCTIHSAAKITTDSYLESTSSGPSATGVYLSGATNSGYIQSATTTLRHLSGVPDGSSAIGYSFDTANSLVTSGAKHTSWKNAGTELMYLDSAGDAWIKTSLTVVGTSPGSGTFAVNEGLIETLTTSLGWFAPNGATWGNSGQATSALAAIYPTIPQIGFDTTLSRWVMHQISTTHSPIVTETSPVTMGSGTAVGFPLNIGSGSSGNDKILSLRANTVEQAYFDRVGNLVAPSFTPGIGSAGFIANVGGKVGIWDGATRIATFASGGGIAANLATTYAFYANDVAGGFQSAGSTRLTTELADGASAVAGISDTLFTYSTAGAKLWSWRNHTTEMAFLDKDGNLTVGSDISGGATFSNAVRISQGVLINPGKALYLNGSAQTMGIFDNSGHIDLFGASKYVFDAPIDASTIVSDVVASLRLNYISRGTTAFTGTITGGSSGVTATLISDSLAGGVSGAGFLLVKTLSGIFTPGETITGSTGSATFTYSVAQSALIVQSTTINSDVLTADKTGMRVTSWRDLNGIELMALSAGDLLNSHDPSPTLWLGSGLSPFRIYRQSAIDEGFLGYTGRGTTQFSGVVTGNTTGTTAVVVSDSLGGGSSGSGVLILKTIVGVFLAGETIQHSAVTATAGGYQGYKRGIELVTDIGSDFGGNEDSTDGVVAGTTTTDTTISTHGGSIALLETATGIGTTSKVFKHQFFADGSATFGGNAVATSANGQAGGHIEAIAAGTSYTVNTGPHIINATRCMHPIVAGVNARVTIIYVTAGGGGTFSMKLRNTTTSTDLVAHTSISATAAQDSVTGFADTIAGGASIGDDLQLQVNFTGTSTSNPVITIRVEW